MKSWLMMTTDDPVLLSSGYDDDASKYYSWDNKVPLHAVPSVGDSIALWNKKYLLGAAVIEKIVTGLGEKTRYRCPVCHKTKLQTRKKKTPPYWCPECKSGVTDPSEEVIEVSTYRSIHESSWIDLNGELTGGELRSLCYQPKSQHAIREFNWSEFQLAIREDLQRSVARIITLSSKPIIGGHVTRLVRVRRGQREFRKQLVQRYGETCAFSGTAPSDALDAAHLYSYAKAGKHDDMGGLLLRKDLHRLFDLGKIAIEPKSLRIHIDESLSTYPGYQALDGNRIAVEVTPKTKKWISQHWEVWQGDQ